MQSKKCHVKRSLPHVQQQIDLLEAAGLEVTLHHRVNTPANGPRIHGMTWVNISDQDNLIGHGVAVCSVSDNFDRAIGTRVAFRRAISSFYNVVGHVHAKKVLYPNIEA